MSSEKHRSDQIDAELRADALDVLGDALRWRLTATRWVAVRAVVEALEAALREGDAGAVRAAVYELELAGPVRATSVNEDFEEAEPMLRELINRLIRSIDEDEPER